MDKIRFTATLNELSDGAAHISVKGEGQGNEFIINRFLPELYVALFKAMKDTNTEAFYAAMGRFADDDFENLKEWMRSVND